MKFENSADRQAEGNNRRRTQTDADQEPRTRNQEPIGTDASLIPNLLSSLKRERLPDGADAAEVAQAARTRRFEISRIATIPNILSVSRLFLLPVILLLMHTREMIAALCLMCVSWLTDALDGYLARKLNQVTTLGKVLDHAVDKIWVGTILVMLVAARGLPLYIAAAVIGRDLLILVGSLVIMNRRSHLVSSNVIGKITGLSFAVLMLLYVVDTGYPWLHMPKLVMLWVVTGMIGVSFINYVVVYARHMAGRATET